MDFPAFAGKTYDFIIFQGSKNEKIIQDTAQFVKDFKLISDRITNPTQYNDFVRKLTYYLTTYGKDNYIDAIANAVIGSGKVNTYMGIMQVYIKATMGK